MQVIYINIYIYLHNLQRMPVVMFPLTAHGWAVGTELVLSNSKPSEALLLNYQAVMQRGLGSPFPQRVCVHAALRRCGPPLITPLCVAYVIHHAFISGHIRGISLKQA